MARYIDADEFFEGFCICAVGQDKNFIKAVETVLEDTPTADVVEVVRCKDCKHQDDCARQMVHTTRDYVLEQNISTYNKVDFCSYGERKEGDTR